MSGSDAIKSVIDSALGYLKVGLKSQASFSGDAVLTTTYADDYLVRGAGHEIHRIIPVSTTTEYWVLDTTLVSSDFVFSLPIFGNASEDQVYIDTYLIDSYTGGAEIPSTNPTRVTPTASESRFYTGITPGATAGADLRQYIFGAQGQGNVSGGGSSSGNHSKIWNPGDLICFAVTGTAAAISFEFNWLWYEI